MAERGKYLRICKIDIVKRGNLKEFKFGGTIYGISKTIGKDGLIP